MSDSEEPTQQPTPTKSPKTPQRPNIPQRSDSEQSLDDTGYESRSRSQSRRRRRQNQRKRAQQQLQSSEDGSNRSDNPGGQVQSMAKIDEDQVAESQSQAQSSMQPFERIGPDSTSMDGPVTHARAMRGEVPMRDGNPNQALSTAPEKSAESKPGSKGIMDEEGLKLRLELNLDIEIELKASIHGDLTLALLA